MKMRPILPAGIMLLVLAALFGLTALLVIKNKIQIKEKIFTLLRLGLIYFLVFIIGLRPVSIDTNYEFSAKNLDVLLVVDTTLSMWAMDYNGTNERMEGVSRDINTILTELAGSNFGLVTFDDTAHVLAPFTQDKQYIADLLDVLGKPDSYTAMGSNLSVPYRDIESLLLSSNKKENRKTIIFYFSDGEVTNTSSEMSYESLKDLVDTGAVLGYGTEKGGKMREGHTYVYDHETYSDALSKIDEENLQKIADELGVQYLNMNSGNTALEGLIEIIKQHSETVVEQGTGAERYIDTYYIYAAVLLLLLAFETVIFIRRGRL